MFLLFTDSKQHKARELDLITLRASLYEEKVPRLTGLPA